MALAVFMTKEMRNEVRHYLVTENLRNGSEVTIRAIRPEDEGLIVEAFKELDESTIYMRFFATKKHITDHDRFMLLFF